VADRERVIAENEAFWRELNELAPPEHGVLNTMFCECGRLGCGERIEMTAAEYESVRARPTTFAVVPGHELVDVEVVVDETDRFRVVDKVGVAAAIADRADPRA
jgi:hypothetical protein